MSDRPLTPSRRTTELALRFVAALQAGRKPRIEDSLAAAPTDEWKPLLHSLLLAEVNHRKAQGERPLPREYLSRFPAFASIIRSVLPDLPASVLVRDGVPVAVPVQPLSAPAAETELALRTTETPTPPGDLAATASPGASRRGGGWMIGAAVGLLLLTAIGLVVANRLPRSSETGAAVPPARTGPPAVAIPLKAPPPVRTPPPPDPERNLAEWAADLDGSGTVVLNTGGRRSFGPDEPLPRGKFTVTALALPRRASDRWRAVDLERFRGRVRLDTVHLEHPTDLTDAFLEPLAAPALKGLSLRGDAVRVSGAYLSRFTELETLTLASAPDFSDDDLVALGKLPRLSFLSLNAPRLSPAGVRRLRNPLLKTLSVGPDTVLTADHVRFLQGLPLESFTSEAGMTDDAFLELAIVSTLKRVHVRRTSLTDAGVKAVLGFGRLEEFRAVESAIAGPGLELLCEHRALRVLDLTGAKVTDEALEKLLDLPVLRELRLAACPISDRGAVFLAQLDRLETLDLSDTSITDATLGMLKKHQSLKRLLVMNTQVTAPAVRDFERGTPDCRVEWGPRQK